MKNIKSHFNSNKFINMVISYSTIGALFSSSLFSLGSLQIFAGSDDIKSCSSSDVKCDAQSHDGLELSEAIKQLNDIQEEFNIELKKVNITTLDFIIDQQTKADLAAKGLSDLIKQDALEDDISLYQYLLTERQHNVEDGISFLGEQLNNKPVLQELYKRFVQAKEKVKSLQKQIS